MKKINSRVWPYIAFYLAWGWWMLRMIEIICILEIVNLFPVSSSKKFLLFNRTFCTDFVSRK